MGYTAFQSNGAYQRNAYQIVVVTGAPQGGGKYSRQTYELGKYDYEREQHKKRTLEKALTKQEAKISRTEDQRRDDLADTQLQLQLLQQIGESERLKRELALIEAAYLQYQQLLRIDEDDIMALLYSMPFMA